MTSTIEGVVVPAPPRAGAAVVLRPDASGRPIVSGTFVLQRTPLPDERLGPLVHHGTVAFEVSVVDLEVNDPVESLTVELRDGTDVLAAATVSGPFLHAALHADLDAGRARSALEAMLGAPTTLAVHARVRTRAGTATPTRVQVDLGPVWSTLDGAADASRRFLPVDIDNYLQRWLAHGVVRVVEGDDDLDHLRAAFLRAARPVLGDDLSLAASGPGTLTVTAAGPAGGAVAPAEVEVIASLSGLVAARIAADLAQHVHVLGQQDGELLPVPPVRATRGTRAGPTLAGLHVMSAGRIVGLGTALRPEHELRPLPIRPEALALIQDRPQVHALATIAVPDGVDRRPGPVVGRTDAPFWVDRWDSTKAWYLPVFRLVAPEPTMPADEAPFRYELEPDAGHVADGSAALVATITVTLRPEVSAETKAGLDAAGHTSSAPVPLTSATVQLAIPFRDEHGSAQVEIVTATSVEPEGPLGEPGSTLTATFRLLDNWARLAYGALSTAGFQAQPASVAVSTSFEGWSEQRRPHVLGLDKRWALTGFATRGTVAVRPTAALLATPLVTAAVRPAWQFRPDLLDRLDRTTYTWRQFNGSGSDEAFVPCNTFGTLYRERRDGEWHDIGCRPALQLGEVEYKTYEPLTVAAAGTFGKVFRSLRTPGRFLVVPTTYAVGRYGAGSGDQAYRPRMLLHSSVDEEDPTDIRCVLAASLEPVLPPYARAAILAELRESVHAEPVLEYLPDTGVAVDVRWAVPGATDISCLTTDSGFDVVCTADLQGFLALRSMIERGGLNGVAEARMPGGVRAAAALKIGLADVTGPFDTGPIELRADAEKVVVVNRSGQRTAVRALASAGRQVVAVEQVLDPAAELTVERGGVDPGVDLGALDVVYEHDRGAESLDEVRAYIEDLQVGVLFVSTADPAAHGLAGLEIQTRFLGRDDPAPLMLTAEQRDGERNYVLPLTTFAADPVLEFTVVAVGTDGARQETPQVSWPVRSRGALIPVGPPT